MLTSKRYVVWQKNLPLWFRFLWYCRINRALEWGWNAVSFKVWGGKEFSGRVSDGDIVMNSDQLNKPSSRGFISVMLWEAYLGREEENIRTYSVFVPQIFTEYFLFDRYHTRHFRSSESSVEFEKSNFFVNNYNNT